MNKTTFKEKSMIRWSLVTKEASNRQQQMQERPNHTHNSPNNFLQHQTHQKGGCTRLFKEQRCVYVTFGQNLNVYMDFGQKPACICDFWPKLHVCTRILAKNLHVYVTFGQKSVYVRNFWPKTHVYKEGSGKK